MIRNLALGILFVLWLLSILVPPWESDRLVAKGTRGVIKPAGYALIFDPPYVSKLESIRIDYGRLALEWLFLGSLAGGTIVYFQWRKP